MTSSSSIASRTFKGYKSHFWASPLPPFTEVIVSQSFQLGQTMLSLVFYGLPYILFVCPCMIIYLRLMAFITYRPINSGMDPKRETVFRKKTNLMTAGETMNLIVITGQ